MVCECNDRSLGLKILGYLHFCLGHASKVDDENKLSGLRYMGDIYGVNPIVVHCRSKILGFLYFYLGYALKVDDEHGLSDLGYMGGINGVNPIVAHCRRKT